MSKQNLANLLYEIADLNHIYRSGMKQFCFEDFETIASHLHRVTAITYILAKITKADMNKSLIMALFHDATETRTGDSNWIQKSYIEQNEEKVIRDQWEGLSNNIGDNIIELQKEYHQKKST